MAKVLVIDDDLLFIEIFKKSLLDAGFAVDVAYDGDEGIKKMKTSIPDAVLLDIVMPKMNGMEVIDLVREDTQLRKIPIIVVTNLPADKEDLLQRGVIGCFLKKEFEPDEVVLQIQSILQGKDA